jgi:FdhD protein
MGRRRSERLLVGRPRPEGGWRRAPDDLVVEEPLEIHLDGTLVATTMRTPGHDFELAVGWCHGEGLLGGVEVTEVRYCATGSAVETGFNVVTVATTGGRAGAHARRRLTTTTSSCGLCGTGPDQLAALTERLGPLDPTIPRVEPGVCETVPDAVRPHQELFARTGAVHAAAVFDAAGTVTVVREDIGRHNAVDKVVGRLRLDGVLPAGSGPDAEAAGWGLFVSGRASFEMVQKAWAGGFATVVAVSAPSALAVATAERAGIRLLGFARNGRMNVYTGGDG